MTITRNQAVQNQKLPIKIQTQAIQAKVQAIQPLPPNNQIKEIHQSLRTRRLKILNQVLRRLIVPKTS